jgi:Tfp pilus assembly protein PilF
VKTKMKNFNAGNSTAVSAGYRLSGAGRFLILALSLLLSCPASPAATKFEQLCEEGENAYRIQRYPEAERAFTAAVAEGEKLDKSDKRIATTVYNLALVFQAENNYAESEKTFLKSLDLTRTFYGDEHQRTARIYMDIADLYVAQLEQDAKPELKKKAAENYQKGIDIFEKIYSQANADTESAPAPKSDPSEKASKKGEPAKITPQEAALDLSNALRSFAKWYAEDEQYREAEPLFRRSLELEEFASGAESKDLARHKAALAETYCVQGKYKDAAPLFKDALEVAEKTDGPEGKETARILYNFGGLHYDQGEFSDAEIKFKRALKAMAKDPEVDQLDLAQKHIALADVLDMQGKAEEAQSVYKLEMPIFDKCEDRGALIRFLKQYQKHLLMQNKKEEAAKISVRIKDIKAQQVKPQ